MTYAPTATNTAGTFRLDTGNRIRAAIQGKDYIFVLTDSCSLCNSICWSTIYFFC